MSKPTYEELEAQVKQLAAECDAVVAENVALNKFIKDDCFIYTSDDIEPRDANEFKPETPATDAILASLRAEGVEMFAEQQRSHIGMPNKNDAASSYSSREAIKFAAQLRSQSEQVKSGEDE